MTSLAPTTPRMRPHLSSLTWARGIAAFLVVVSHTFRASQSIYSADDSKAEFFAFRLLDLGDFGVSLFFTLSGCVLYLSSGGMALPSGIITFYVKRFARIWPAFFVSILVYIAVSFFFNLYYTGPHDLWIGFLLKDWTFSELISYITLTSDIFGPMYYFNNVYWSMPIEFRYYLIFPLLVFTLRNVGTYGVVATALLLYVLGWLELLPIADIRFFTMAYMFCGGLLCAHLSQGTTPRLTAYRGILLLVSVLLFASGVRNNVIPLLHVPIFDDKFTWYGIAAIAAIYLLLKTDWTNAPHGRIVRFLSYYGDISYSTYLFHNVLIALSVLCVIKFNIVGNSKLAVIFFVAVVGTYLLATLSYRYIEKPWIDRAQQWARFKRST